MLLYLTADTIAAQTGGGRVTAEESLALSELAQERGEEFRVIDRSVLESDLAICLNPPKDPWQWDFAARHMFGNKVKLCHLYAGTFSETVKKLKENGAKVCYTIAAHDREVSRREHEQLGIDFAGIYKHLCDPVLWHRYSDGYRRADVIICPGSVPAATVRRYGSDFANKQIEIVPHGTDMPVCEGCGGSVIFVDEEGYEVESCDRCCLMPGVEPVAPFPTRFTVGYMGAVGLDKGLRYLFAAWKKLAYKDALLIVAGKDSTSSFVRQLWDHFGGGNVHFAGWQDSPSDLYNQISLYVQSSATEGFGIEVVEAMAAGRPVLCSDGAGACDLVNRDYDPPGSVFPAMDADKLAEAIHEARTEWEEIDQHGEEGRERFRKSVIESCRDVADDYTWPKIRERYKAVWRKMLS